MTATRFRRTQRHPLQLASHRAERPLATILICNHNYERFAAAAVESALAQTYRPVEVVVVDDGSTDGSRRCLAGYGERIRLILQANAGQPSALNAGFRASRGRIVCLLDADDVFMPTKVARIAEILERNPQAGWVFHELDYVDAAGRALPIEALPDREDVRSILRRRARYRDFAEIDLRDAFAAGMKLPYAAPALSALSFRREVLETVLPMPEDIARASDEFPKIATIALFPGIHIGEALALQRIHGGNAASFRAELRIAEATRYLKTAYHLRRRFRQIGPSTDKWFAASFGRLLGAGGARTALAPQETRRYFAEYFTPLTWVRQTPRIFLNAARARLGERLGRAKGGAQ